MDGFAPWRSRPAPVPSLSWREEVTCRSGSAHQTMGSVCAKKVFRRARQALLMLLAALRFRHRRLTGSAAPGPPEVDGSATPLFGLPGSAARDGPMCTAMPPRAGGRSRRIHPCRKAVEPMKNTAKKILGPPCPARASISEGSRRVARRRRLNAIITPCLTLHGGFKGKLNAIVR